MRTTTSRSAHAREVLARGGLRTVSIGPECGDPAPVGPADAAGCSLDDVAFVTVLLAQPADFAGMNSAYASVFSDDPPARAVTRLGPELAGILVSITMTAHIAEESADHRI